MVKRKNSTTLNEKTKKKTKKQDDVNAEITNAIVNNLIELAANDSEKHDAPTNGEKDDTAFDDSDKYDQNSNDESDDDYVFTPNLPNTASIPVVISSCPVSEDPETVLKSVWESVLMMKNTLEKVVETNRALTSDIKDLKKSNMYLKKKVKIQEKMAKVTLNKIVKLKKQHKNRPNPNESNSSETVDEIIRPIIQERDSLKDEVYALKLASGSLENEVLPPRESSVGYSGSRNSESLENRKTTVIPRWRQLFFRRRDEFKREYRNREKAKVYEKYEEIKFLPRKFRPKFARTQEEYDVKESAAFKSLQANKQCCVMDADQAFWNYSAADEEALNLIRDSGVNENEVQFLTQLWKREAAEAEPKAKSLCQKELNYMNNLPYTDHYKGFSAIANNSNPSERNDASYQGTRNYNNRYNTDRSGPFQNNNWQVVAPRGKKWKNTPRNGYKPRSFSQNGQSNTNNGGWKSYGNTDYGWSYPHNYNSGYTQEDTQQNFHY